MKNNTVIYTAIFGGYDRLIEPVEPSKDIDYICFTDGLSKFTSEAWKIEIVEPHFKKDMVRSARLIKICPHRFLGQYEYSLWIDGSRQLISAPDVPSLLNGKTIAMEKHRSRRCVYVEAETCKEQRRDDPKIIDQQIAAYKKLGLPKRAGLYATYMIARKHGDMELILLNEEWWKHLCEYSRRDQISLPVVFYRYPIENISSTIRRKIIRTKRHSHKGRRNGKF